MRRIVVGATTHIDRHNTRMTKQALESMVYQINSDRKPISTIEHDTTLPPIGKILKAWIEPTEDGEYKLLVEQEIFEKEEAIILPDGSRGLIRQSDTDHNAFVNKAGDIPEQITLGADFANFASPADYEGFVNEVRATSPISFECQEIGRKSYIPDPEIIITFSKAILAYLAAKKIIDKFGDKVSDKLSDKLSDDIADFYIWVKSVANKLTKYIVPKNRPITYVFSIPITPHVELVARTSDASEVAASIMEDNLENPLKLAQELHDKLGAERIQFLLDKSGEWKFNYLLTDKGAVIGTEESFSRKARQVDLPLPRHMIIPDRNRLKRPSTTTSKKNKRRKR